MNDILMTRWGEKFIAFYPNARIHTDGKDPSTAARRLANGNRSNDHRNYCRSARV